MSAGVGSRAAVLPVLTGGSVTEVAREIGVARQTLSMASDVRPAASKRQNTSKSSNESGHEAGRSATPAASWPGGPIEFELVVP
ncbi:MAG TPA: hypothetical protein VFV66_00200, partial [Nonomuraea sp.]|nr:hypothetical protein [Nonomuraea sp.]